MQQLRYWIWLSQLNISPKARSAVLQAFETPEAAFRAESGCFRHRAGISAREAEALEARDLSGVEGVLAACEEQELRVLTYADGDYPERLRQIFAPPAVLYVKGELPPLDTLPVVSVIGTRKASPYGVKMGERLARQISLCGGLVVSLLSQGVDEAAARGALRAGKACVGVLGTPHEACRLRIAEDIASFGALLSEYAPGTECSRHFFRERNRVAAGISDGVVVIEAPEKSGTRFFVADAVEQGKDVFAVPGNADAENAAGTLALLKEGAKLVTCGKEVMEEYVTRYPGKVDPEAADILPENTEPAEAAAAGRATAQPEAQAKAEAASEADTGTKPDIREQLAMLTEDQLKIVASIDSSSTHVDDIVERSGLGIARVLAQLTVLEIKGYVRREAGRRFSLNISTEK